MSVRKTMGARIAQARRELAVREDKDVTKAMLAKAAGVDPSAITLYESDKSNVGEEVLGRLADYLGVTPAWLRYGVGKNEKPADHGGLEDVDVGAVLLTPAQLERAEEAVAAREAAERLASQRARGARQPGKKAR